MKSYEIEATDDRGYPTIFAAEDEGTKDGRKKYSETGSSDSGSDNKTFMGKLEENSDDEDLFDDIPPFVPDATQGKLLIDPDATALHVVSLCGSYSRAISS